MFWVDMECFLCKGMKFFFSEKDVFFYFNRQSLPPNVAFVVNLCLIMGKYHIHKQKWAKGKPNFFFFNSDRNEKLL